MKFYNLLFENLLNEISGDELHQKYFPKFDRKEFFEIIKADPKTQVVNGVVINVGKYAQQLLRLYQKKGFSLEDIDKASEYLNIVYKYNVKIDIPKMRSLGELYDAVKFYIARDSQSFDEILKVLPTEEYKILFRGHEWTIYQPLTERASCWLGYNTQWCTTWGQYCLDKRYRERENHFHRHNNMGPLFILIKNSDTDYKFQFHFESNQFMNASDNRIDAGQLLEKNMELTSYFFPSLVSDENSTDTAEMESKRLEILPKTLFANFFEKYNKDNKSPLIDAIIHDNKAELVKLIQSDNLAGEPSIINYKLYLELKKAGDLIEYHDYVSYYESDLENAGDRIYDDQYNNDENNEERLEEFAFQFYEKNKNELRTTFGIMNKDQFKEAFVPNYVKDRDIKAALIDDIIDSGADSFREICRSRIDEVEKYIKIDSYGYQSSTEVYLPIDKFCIFLVKKNVQQIQGDIVQFLVEYCEDNHLPNVDGYEYVYEYDYKLPGYGGKNELTKYTDRYFEKLIENYDIEGPCIEYRKKFADIFQKFFKGKMFYETEDFTIVLKSTKVNCANGTVNVIFKNKKTGEEFGKHIENNIMHDEVKIDNLVSILTNHKLFENKLKLINVVKYL